MSTSDQNGPQLTRKQLREIRLTGSTPVIGESKEEPASQETPAQAEPAPEKKSAPEKKPAREKKSAAEKKPAPEKKSAPEKKPAREPDTLHDFDAIDDEEQVREEPAARRGLIRHIVDEVIGAPSRDRGRREESVAESASTPAAKPNADVESAAAHSSPDSAGQAPLTRRQMREQERIRTGSLPVQDERDAEEPAAEPESNRDSDAVKSIFEAASGEPGPATPASAKSVISGLPAFEFPEPEPEPTTAVEPEAEIAPKPAGPVRTAPEAEPADEQPKVGAAFGIGVKNRAHGHKAPTAFEDLIDSGSAGSHKTSSTLIFTPSPDAGSLSGPIASTGELLVTGSYSLPEGLGSRGHAQGTTDGKEADAVLIDGELAPTSSPTPIAASSAISTLKPAGEVIRPPAPDKSGKLTLTLAIVAGGLGLALAAVIAIAAFTGVFS